LRNKIKYQGKLTPAPDIKIWKYEMKTQIADLGKSLEECEKIVKVLEDIQTNCART